VTRIRPYQPDDLDGMLGVQNASADAEAGQSGASRSGLASYWGLRDRRRPAGLWVAEEGGQIVAYAGLRPWHSLGWLQAEVVVHPAERGRGVGGTLLRHLVRAARRRSTAYLCAITPDAHPDRGTYLERHGFQPFVRRQHMRLEPVVAPAAADVPGFAVRAAGPADCGALARINNASYPAGERVGRADAAGYQRFIEASGAQVWVAEQVPAGPVVGLCEVRQAEVALNGAPVRTGHIGSLAVLPAYRQRGLGRRLLVRGIELCRENGWPTVELNVDRDNEPALHLYESTGFRAVYAFTVYRLALAAGPLAP